MKDFHEINVTKMKLCAMGELNGHLLNMFYCTVQHFRAISVNTLRKKHIINIHKQLKKRNNLDFKPSNQCNSFPMTVSMSKACFSTLDAPDIFLTVQMT